MKVHLIRHMFSRGITWYKDLFTLLGIMGAAFWFIYTSEYTSRLNTKHTIDSYVLNSSQRYVSIGVQVENVGNAEDIIDEGIIYVQKVLPLSDQVDKILRDPDMVDKPITDIPLPLLLNYDGENAMYNIEPFKVSPKEVATSYYGYVILCTVEVVKVTTNLSSQKREVFWEHSNFYEFEKDKKCTLEY